MKLVTSLALLACTVTAQADVQQAAADSFLITFSAPVTATPMKAYAALGAVQSWWSSQHTWSGNAANLSLKMEAGGCFCERWAEGSVEHGRVIMAVPQKLLRLEAALGPLQEFALNGVLTFWINSNEDGSTRVDVAYRVNGSSTSGLDTFAPQVDEVIGVQVARLQRYIDTGNAEDTAAQKKPPLNDAPTPDGAPSKGADPDILAEWAKQAAQAAADAKQSAAPKAKPAKPKANKPKDDGGA
jgi:uncharacterized protein YndB with AHSA1/START domain